MSFINSTLAHLQQEPIREILKLKYRAFRFRGVAALWKKVQPRYRRRLKWQIFDAAISAKSEESVKELAAIFESDPEPLNVLLPPALKYVTNGTDRASGLLDEIMSGDGAPHDIKRAAYFFSLIVKWDRAARRGGSLRRAHFQYWDKNAPADVHALLRKWERQTKSGYLLYDDQSARNLLLAHFGVDLAKAYDSCPHPAAKSDLFRLCAIYQLGGSYSDADTRPRNGCFDLWDELTERPMFWISTDFDFMPRSWFLSAPPKAPIYEKFIREAVFRLKSGIGKRSIFEITGPGMMADVLFDCRDDQGASHDLAGFPNFFGEWKLLANVSPRYKRDSRSWQLFEGSSPKRRSFFSSAN